MCSGVQQKRDHPSPPREHQQGHGYPGGGRGEPHWAAKRGRMDMPWMRGGRGGSGPGAERYPSNYRGPSYDEPPRGKIIRCSAL